MSARGRLFHFVDAVDDATREAQLPALFAVHEGPRVASRPAADEDLAQRFRRELEALSGEWLDATEDPVDAVLGPWLDGLAKDLERTPRVAVDPQLAEVAPSVVRCFEALGTPSQGTTTLDTQGLAATDLGVTLTDVAIAETGTLVETPRPGRPRALSLLPPHHLAILRRRVLVAGLEDFFDHIDGDFEAPGDPFASYFTWISGPSRTADIEKVLTVGVHGPGRLTVLLI